MPCRGDFLKFENFVYPWVVHSIAQLKDTEYNTYVVDLWFYEDRSLPSEVLKVIDSGEYLPSLAKISSQLGVNCSMLVIEEDSDIFFREVNCKLRVALPTPPGPGQPHTLYKIADIGIKRRKAA